jgi:D-3-phosphoglycerate dehydrogenase
MKTLIADRFSESARAKLSEAEVAVDYRPDLATDDLAEAVAESGADVLVVRSTRVDARALAAGDLRLVIRAGAGFNTIDVGAATELGIRVSNCPGGNAHAVAELAFGLILALDRHIPDSALDLRQGRWNKIGYSDAAGLYGSTLGVLGLGNTGRAMVPRARAFGMPVVAWSRSLTVDRASELGVRFMPTPLDVASASDVVSVHVALNDATRGLVDAAFLDAMRPGAILINTSRAEVVDEAALARAVKSRGLRAGLDVFSGEPSAGVGAASDSSGLFRLPGVIGTHHTGGATRQAQQAIADETVRIVLEFRATGVAPNAVN